MGKSLMMASGVDTTTANTTQYCPVIGNIVLTTTELEYRIPFREAGVISNLAVIIINNGIAGSGTVRLRKNGANGNQIITIPNSTNGYFEDTTNTDSIVAGDQLNIMHTPGASTGTLQLVQVSFIFTPTNNNITHSRFAITGIVSQNVSTNNHHPFSANSQNTITTLTSNNYITPKVAGNFKHFALYSSVAGNRAINNRFIKNGVDDAVARAALASGVTGLNEDTTSSLSVNGSSDTCSFLVGIGGGTTSRNFVFSAVSFENTGDYFLLINGRAEGNAENFGVTRFYHLGGRIINNTSESTCRSKARIPLILSNLYVRVSQNSINTGNIVITLRKNGANGNSTVTIPAGSTGLFEDTVNSDNILASDEINLQAVISGTSGTITFTIMSMLAKYDPIVNAISDYKDVLRQRTQQLITNSI